MASEALLLLLKLNLAGAAAIVFVLMLRAAMRRAFGARAAYALWGIVPVAMLAIMLPARVVAVKPVETATVAAGATGGAEGPLAQAALQTSVDWSFALALVWIAGAVAMLGVLAWRQRAFMTSLGRLSHVPGETRTVRAETGGVGPAIIGALWPKLVLPKDFEARFAADEREVVLAHERVHLRGGDARINGIVALAQCLCWFNPLVHLAAYAMRIDQELACDAAVVARYPRSRRVYAEAMLKTQIAPMSLPVGCFWPAGGAHPLKLRIAMLKRGLPGKMRAAWGGVAAALACLATGCVVWIGQPAREVEATSSSLSSPVSPEQAEQDARLLRAVRIGGTGFAEAALASGANVNARNREGLTALIIAARAEDMQLVNLLLDHGADVNLTSPGEGNALVAAARRDHVYAVAALIEHGAEVNTIAPDVGTPLAASVRAEQFRTVKYLVEHGADVNLRSPLQAPWDRLRGPRTPLEFAIGSGHPSIIDYLKSKGARM